MEEQAPYDTSFTAAPRRRLLAAFQRIRGAVGPKPASPPSPSAVIAVECVEEALAQFCARLEATDGVTEGDLHMLALALLHEAAHLTIGCDECAPHAQVGKIVTIAQRVQQLAALYRAEQRLLPRANRNTTNNRRHSSWKAQVTAVSLTARALRRSTSGPPTRDLEVHPSRRGHQPERALTPHGSRATLLAQSRPGCWEARHAVSPVPQ